MERRIAPIYHVPFVSRWFWGFVWSAHALAALLWWWFTPGGFPLDHAKCWANSILPWVVIALAFLGLTANLRRHPVLFAAAVLFPPTFWLTIALVSPFLFPFSALLPFLLGRFLGGFLALQARVAWWYRPSARAPAVAVVAATTLIVLALLWAQHAPTPGTHPLNEPLPEPIPEITGPDYTFVFRDGLQATGDGDVAVECGGLSLAIAPLLSFQARSVNRGWKKLELGPEGFPYFRELMGARWEGEADTALRLRFKDGYADNSSSHLTVRSWGEQGVDIDASCYLDDPAYSHWNNWCEVTVKGARELSLEFSPCPGVRVVATPHWDRTRSPLRFAYVDAGDVFHVAEAARANRGPFCEIARGPLQRSDSLTITLCDGGKSVCRLVFSDWSAQVDHGLSPTAGWGLPVNGIEFWRMNDKPDSDCSISLSLARTSIGRGSDGIGHAPGVYRNRLRVEPVR